MASEGSPDFWESFGVDKLEEIPDISDDSLAQQVLNKFGILCSDAIGGSLGNLDIKQTDALTVVRLSLLEYSAKSGMGFHEVMMNVDGEAEFVEIGKFNGMSNVDIYYEIQTSAYVEKCTGVMVTGGKPRPTRLPVNWKPIWGDANNGNREAMIYDFEAMLGNCLKERFQQHCTIVYDDPHLTTGSEGYRDGYDSLFEELYEESPYNNIIGYARYIKVPKSLLSNETSVQRKAESKVFIRVGNGDDGAPGGVNGAYLGTRKGLLTRPTFKDSTFGSSECYRQSGGTSDISPTNGVKVVLPNNLRYTDVNGRRVDKFIGVSAVYVIAYVIDGLIGTPATPSAAIRANSMLGKSAINIELSISNSIAQVVKLAEGEHYIVAYSTDGAIAQPYIMFANGASAEDPAQYGTACAYRIDPYCSYIDTPGVDPDANYTGSVLPTGVHQGLLVQEIYVTVDVNTPSIEISDPNGSNNKAKQIALGLEYQLTPLAIFDPPAPIGYAGERHSSGIIVDQTKGVQDHRPDTTQNFKDTELEKIIDEMAEGGGGLTLNFSFLEKDECKRLAKVLYEYMNSGDGVISTYICGPESEPRLGGYGPDSSTVVNDITYSYSDSNSYTISVTTGPKIIGNLTQVDGGLTLKASENTQAQGTIIQDQGSNVWFKVRIDGYDDAYAINTSPNLLRVGDKVNVTIHNNPIES